MASAAGETRFSLLRSLGELVRSDPVVQLAVGAYLFAALAQIYPRLTPEVRGWETAQALPVLCHGLAVFALLWHRRRIPRREERRFWGDLAIAFGAWLGKDLLYLVPPTDGGYRPGWVYLGSEVFFSVFYLAFILALERQPHRYDRWRPAGLEGMLIRPAMAVFIAGLAVYFLIVPVAIDPGSYRTFLPSMFFYLTLDAFLTGKVLLLRRAAAGPRWRSLYTLLAATVVLASASDLVECLAYLAPGWSPPGAELLWLAYNLPVILAARLRRHRFPEPERRPVEPRTAQEELATPSLTTLLLALSFPAIHLGAYAGGWLDGLAEPARELLVMAELFALGTIALIQHRLFRRRARQLEAQRAHAERALRKSESSVRLMLERRQNEERLQQAEERFAKIFRSAPAGLVITTVPEGRMLELNDHFQQISGFDRGELLGRTTRELRFWCRESDREEMMRQLREQGSVRELVTPFRTRSGDRIDVLLSAEPMEIDGEACLLTVVRDVTEWRRAEERRRAQAALLDLADAAVMVVGADGRVSYRNPGAEELAPDGDDPEGRRPEVRLPEGRRVPLRGAGDADGEEMWIARASRKELGGGPPEPRP
jgi:PAS domain S-box-containing protein